MVASPDRARPLPHEVHGRPLQLLGRVRIETAASVWFVEPTRYQRLPNSESPRAGFYCPDGALDDAVWHAHLGAFLEYSSPDDGFFLRLIPAARPAGASGITTGIVRDPGPLPACIADDESRKGDLDAPR